MYDVLCATNITEVREHDIYYDKIYYQTNEMLKELFHNFDVRGKDVLTVLASSDQLFYAYNYGAKSVDTFDINKLAYYYYYLRKWGILYLDKYYPPIHDIIFSHKFINDVFYRMNVVSEEDREAYFFWREYCKHNLVFENSDLYYINTFPIDSTISDLSYLKSILETRKLSFKHLDITKEIDIDKKYDVIILSNIMEYLGYDTSYPQIIDNFNRLLKDDGIIVCSHFIFKEARERFYLRGDFKYEEFPNFKKESSLKAEGKPIGYCYKKRYC